MTATFATRRIRLIEGLIAADLEVDRLLGRLEALGRRAGASRHPARPDAQTPLERAYLRRVEVAYGEVQGRLLDARARSTLAAARCA